MVGYCKLYRSFVTNYFFKEKLKSLVSSSFQMLTKTTNSSSGGKNPPESSSSMGVEDGTSERGASSSFSKDNDDYNESKSRGNQLLGNIFSPIF